MGYAKFARASCVAAATGAGGWLQNTGLVIPALLSREVFSARMDSTSGVGVEFMLVE